MDTVLHHIVGMLARILFDFFLLGLARLLLPVISFGRVRIAPMRRMPMFAIRPVWERASDGAVVIRSGDVAGLIGFLFLVTIIGIVCLAISWRS